MKNKNYYPFERNNFFYGKLLTVRDFELEQRYFNNKRRIQNRLLYGGGVVAGLDVVQVDDQSISLEMGMALDYHGREIIVQEPAIKKLHLLNGFETVKNSRNVYLCIEYDEELSEPVHSVASSPGEEDSGSRFNRISESYRLFLTDEPLPPDVLTLYKHYKEKKIIFDHENVTVEQIVPRYVSEGQRLEFSVNIIKKGTMEPLELSYEINAEHLADEKGSKKVKVFYQEKGNNSHLNLQLNYTLLAHNVKNATEQLKISKDSFSLKLGESEYPLEKDSTFPVQIITEPVKDKLHANYFCQDFSELIPGNQLARIYLAKLNIITSNDLYLIESLEKMPFSQYVLNNELLHLMFLANVNNEINVAEKPGVEDIEEEIRNLMAECLAKDDTPDSSWSTGLEEIDLGFEDNKKNKRFFSNEIAHGLGTGPVAMVLALEINDNILDSAEESILVFGDNSVFDRTVHKTGLPEYRVGALAYPDKGTFRIGIQLFANVSTTSIKVRWWAFKNVEEGLTAGGLLELSKIKVSIAPDTVTLAPREKAHFTAQVEGTKYKECRWLIKEDNGGSIDHNGVYQAPNQEGVFEIIAENVKYPEKKASAFVVVKG